MRKNAGEIWKKAVCSILLLLSCVLAVSGCDGENELEDVPEDVQENDRERRTEMEEESLMKRQTLDEIWDTWEEALKREYKNIELPAGLHLEKPEKIGVFRFVQSDDILEREEQIFDEFIPKKRRVEKYYKENLRAQPAGPEYVNEKTGEHLYLGNTGFFNYQRNDRVEEYDDTEILETVYLNRPYTDKTYRLRDGKISLEKAVKLAEKMVERWERAAGHEFETRVRKVDVYSAKDREKQVLVFSFEKCYKGINIMTDLESNEVDPDDTVLCCDDRVTVASCSRAESYLSTEGIIYKKGTIQELKQLVSLESALKQLEGKIAGQMTRIALSYRMCNPKGAWCRHEAGTEYVAKPYWVFYFCEETGEEAYAMVDCQMGNLDYVK